MTLSPCQLAEQVHSRQIPVRLSICNVAGAFTFASMTEPKFASRRKNITAQDHRGEDWGIHMIMPADRLTTLEIRAAEQEKTIEELSGQIAEQWKVIERMQRKLDSLTDRFLALEEQTGDEVPVTKPPHW